MLSWNKDVIQRYYQDILNRQQFHLIDELFSNELNGREEYKQFISDFCRTFPDIHFDVLDMIAEGDRVVARWSFRATQEAEYLHHAATRRKVTVGGTDVFQIKNGQVVAMWDSWDQLGLLQQLGLNTM